LPASTRVSESDVTFDTDHDQRKGGELAAAVT
jgi:hypothetical protein